MNMDVLSDSSLLRRRYWVEEIVKISGKFGDDTTRLSEELAAELQRDGISALLDHLRLCGAIPEGYKHDSSEEKLYSKYTDELLAAAFRQLDLVCHVMTERADTADVEVVAANYSFVADAKAFRLSRTAKNQKDFKIEALHGWKRGKPHAMVVCPVYQLPTRTSQIYQQAINRQVCIFTYAHLAVLVEYSAAIGVRHAQQLLLKILGCTEELNPNKDAVAYWTCINRTMLSAHLMIKGHWQREKVATAESVACAKEEALTTLAREREKIMRLSREEAIASLIKEQKIDGRERTIHSVADNGILTISA